MPTPSISERLVPRIFNRYVAISVGSVLVVISVVRAYKKRKQWEQKRNSYPRDVVILHHLEPGFNAPRFKFKAKRRSICIQLII